MEAHRNLGKFGRRSPMRGAAGRRNAVLIAVVSALLAAALIYLFVSTYSKNRTAQVAPTQITVWVAAHNIPQGTSEAAIAGEGYFKPKTVPSTQVVPGAITDPSEIVGEAATTDIVAGQQITAGDFTKTVSTLSGLLKGDQRAVAFTLDTEHGLTSYLTPGDTVDVMAEKGKTSEMLIQNAPVLANAGGLVVLRLTDRQALIVTAATLTSSLWLALRPSIGATNSVKLYAVAS